MSAASPSTGSSDECRSPTGSLVAGSFPLRLAFHLGPQVTALLDGDVATLRWSCAGRPWQGRLSLPSALNWRAFRGSLAPTAGWYSPAFGDRVPGHLRSSARGC